MLDLFLLFSKRIVYIFGCIKFETQRSLITMASSNVNDLDNVDAKLNQEKILVNEANAMFFLELVDALMVLKFVIV